MSYQSGRRQSFNPRSYAKQACECCTPPRLVAPGAMDQHVRGVAKMKAFARQRAVPQELKPILPKGTVATLVC